MSRPPDIVANVQFYSTEKGGRKGPTPERMFRCPLEFEGEKFDCGLHLEQIGAIKPGMSATIPITLLFPKLIKSRLKIGSQFKLWELQPVAEGVVTEVNPNSG